jgi:hypothetical protein
MVAYPMKISSHNEDEPSCYNFLNLDILMNTGVFKSNEFGVPSFFSKTRTKRRHKVKPSFSGILSFPVWGIVQRYWI